MKSALELSDYFILLLIVGIFSLCIYILVKFMRNKD